MPIEGDWLPMLMEESVEAIADGTGLDENLRQGVMRVLSYLEET
jgi:hypothetical protein